MTKPLLSICIATYNRAEYIGGTLESIIPQVTDEVEIVIVDGASTDDTGNVVKRYAEGCKQINYILLPSKGGVDQDFCEAVEHAKGEYCWLFSDDDLLKPDAISAVLKEVVKGYSLIVVNAHLMTGDFSKVIENKRLLIDTNEVFSCSEMELLFNRVVTYMSFIGCVVIKRDLWMQREKKRYFGTEFIHVGVIFQAPLPAPALVMAEPYIMIRGGNAQWAQRAFEIGVFKWSNLLYSFTNLSEYVRRNYRPKPSWARFKNIIAYRAMGTYSLKEYHKYFASKDSPLWWRLVALIIAIMPACIVNLVMLTYFKMLKKEARMDIYCLQHNENNIMNIMRTRSR
jgi:glycosyltransferase involved in cell wall biosynthesis